MYDRYSNRTCLMSFTSSGLRWDASPLTNKSNVIYSVFLWRVLNFDVSRKKTFYSWLWKVSNLCDLYTRISKYLYITVLLPFLWFFSALIFVIVPLNIKFLVTVFEVALLRNGSTTIITVYFISTRMGIFHPPAKWTRVS